MAPILVSAVGVPHVEYQPELLQLWKSLSETQDACTISEILQQRNPQSFGEEQVDLHQWIVALNHVDAVLTQLLREYPLLLIAPHPTSSSSSSGDGGTGTGFGNKPPHVLAKHCTSYDDVLSVGTEVWDTVLQILQFYIDLMQNATSKSIFGSESEVIELLAASRDDVACLALQVLQQYAVPPSTKSPPDSNASNSTVTLPGGRLAAIAVTHKSFPGFLCWGDDSVMDRHDAILMSSSTGLSTGATTTTNAAATSTTNVSAMTAMATTATSLPLVSFAYHMEDSEQIMHLTLIEEDLTTYEELSGNSNSKKRRRAEPSSTSSASSVSATAPSTLKSTAEIFFLAMDRAPKITAPFALLCHIRIARWDYDDHTLCCSVASMEWRMRATLTLLHTASVDTMTLFTSSQSPEWFVSMTKLAKEIVADSTESNTPHRHHDGITGLSSDTPPFSLKVLAVQCLAALVSRRDSSRLSSVLQDLGVGKSQAFGVLPMLVRYALATLSGSNLAPSHALTGKTDKSQAAVDDEDTAMDLGLAFYEGTLAPPLPREVQVRRALELIDAILTLTSAVTAAPSGTASLVDAGLIPSLLTAISTTDVLGRLDCPNITPSLEAQVHFVTAQAVQILEAAIVTHNQALSGFYDLEGVQMLASRVMYEVRQAEHSGTPTAAATIPVTDTSSTAVSASQRILLLSLVNCLSVVFHQESTNLGGTALRQPELATTVIQILEHVHLYGGQLAALLSNMLSDVMNSDPQIVHFVHSSGMAQAFLNMIGTGNDVRLPVVPELIMSVPTVLSAMALTEDGAKAVAEHNPFPPLLQVFYHPKYAMPQSRCLLSEMTSVVGTGLDEICRHVDRLKPMVLQAVAQAVSNVVALADDLREREMNQERSAELDTERTCLIQYVLNMGQLIEHILHNEDHCDPFVNAGGLDAMLRLFPASMCDRERFLAHVSCLSSPTVSTLHHATIEDTLAAAFKTIQYRYNPAKLMRKVLAATTKQLDDFEESKRNLFGEGDWSLDELPRVPLHLVDDETTWKISSFLRDMATTQWSTILLASTIRAVCQRSLEAGNGWSASEREWKQTLTEDNSLHLLERLAGVYQRSICEVCRVRAEPEFEEEERSRLLTRSKLKYRLRIVCPEGAVVRDGVEIDSCANVGSMELGELVEAFDRCINSSGILRYRTSRGWVSEMTRGHGREPIAEVISLSESSIEVEAHGKRVEISVPSLRTVSLGVASKGQTSLTELYNAMSKLSLQSIRSIPSRSPSFDPDTVGDHVSRTLRFLSATIREALNLPSVTQARLSSDKGNSRSISREGAVLYYGCLITVVHACLFDEKRERRLVNLPLLLSLVSLDPLVETFAAGSNPSLLLNESESIGVFGASLFVLNESMLDFGRPDSIYGPDEFTKKPFQRVSRYVAASFPSVIALFKRLMSTTVPALPVASVMSRVRWKDLPLLLGHKDMTIAFAGSTGDSFFEPERFVAGLQLAVSLTVRTAWLNPKFATAPPHLVYPFVSLIKDVLSGLEDSCKKKTSVRRNRLALSDYFRQRQRQDEAETVDNDADNFEVDEANISMLVEMGFDRDRALDAFESTRSNRVEVAMEYALSHAPPSPATVQRRRQEREERQRRAAAGQAPPPEAIAEQGHEPVAAAIESAGADSIAPQGEAGGMAEHPNQAVGNADGVSEDRAEAQAMDVDGSSDAVSGNPSDENGELVSITKAELATWLQDGPSICCRLLSHIGDSPLRCANETDGSNGSAECEALTVVVSSFLLDLCHSYPNERYRIASEMMEALKEVAMSNATARSLSQPSPASAEASLAALCHATVLFTRALPKTRGLVLKYDLVGILVSIISTALKSQASVAGSSMPVWMSPALLLIDIMAQPLVGFTDTDLKALGLNPAKEGELQKVLYEHRLQAEHLSALSKQVFSSVAGAGVENADQTAFENVPAFFPLLPFELSDSCREICLTLLGAGGATSKPPPGVVHATMLLLLRLLRVPKKSSVFRGLGIAEAILKLPKECRFTGNTGLVALIFRRLLEDESTLLNSMEMEMRAVFVQLQAKKPSSAVNEKPDVSLHSFMEAITPLLCRDAASFLKAIALSVRVHSRPGKTDLLVSLLSSEERSKRASLLATILLQPSSDIRSQSLSITPQVASAQRIRGKSPHKNASHKSHKRQSSSKVSSKKEQKGHVTHGDGSSSEPSPSTHITVLLMNSIASSYTHELSSPDDGSFLWAGNLIEILCELILAVPSCACAVHNYRPNKIKDKESKAALTSNLHHALSGCTNPPRSFASFALHNLLPQDRWSLRLDHQLWDRRKGMDECEIETIKVKRKKAYRITRLSQATARLILALASRPGEGRRRVIADLVFALSGGRLGHGSIGISTHETLEKSNVSPVATDQHALHAWAELCLGIIAPRSTGKSIEGVSVLNAENIRLSLEHGMVHALLFALHRVKLLHPMSTSTCGALLMPLECLTRRSVNDAVAQLVERAGSKNLPDGQQDGKVADVDVVDSALGARRESLEYELMDAEDDELGDNGPSAGDDQSQSSAEDDASSDDSEDESSGAEESSQSMEEDSQEDDISGDDSHSESSDQDIDDEADWDNDYVDGLATDGGAEPNYDFGDEGEEEDVTEPVDQGIEDGWQRIETSAFGGMMFRSRSGGGDGDGNRAQGFIEAAEAMIGTMLNNGEINIDAIRELEGSLGIRIMGGVTRGASGEASGNPFADSFAVRVLGEPPVPPGGDNGRRSEVIGTLPHIHQRAQPDVGYSAFGHPSRPTEVTSVEFVFGGPSVTGCARNYDLLNPETQSDGESEVHFTQLDLQLFPGGAHSVSNVGTHHVLHPLLGGIDLPPANSLVLDLLPHDIRAARQRHETPRRPFDWTVGSTAQRGYFLSNSGTIIRSVRPHSAASMGSTGVTARHVAGPIGWTDDGLPVDATVEEFSSAFETAIASMATSNAFPVNQPLDSNENHAADGGIDGVRADDSGDVAPPDVVMGNVDAQDASHSIEPRINEQSQVADSPGDGDGMASSLEQGLRLSPGNELDNNSTSASAGGMLDDATAADPPPLHGSPLGAEIASNALQSSEEQTLNEGQGESATSEHAEEADDHRGDADLAGALSSNELVCPPDVDPEVFMNLPLEMQQDCVNQYRATQELAAQLDGSSLDPEFLAALPEEMRREVIEQDRRERQMRDEAESRADPSNAQEMDNASFIASLSPELRAEILLTADDAFLHSLPPNIVAEAQILRERATNQNRRIYDENGSGRDDNGSGDNPASARRQASQNSGNGTTRRKPRPSKIRVECNRDDVIYRPKSLPPAIGACDIMLLIRLLYLMGPIRPPRLLQKVFHNFGSNRALRSAYASSLAFLLHGQKELSREAVETLSRTYSDHDIWRLAMDEMFTPTEFPPSAMIGAAPSVPESDVFTLGMSPVASRRKQGQDTAAAIAANLQASSGTSLRSLPSVVCLRIVETLQQLCKISSRFCLHVLVEPTAIATGHTTDPPTIFELLLDLLEIPVFSSVSSNLDQLLTLLEYAVAPLSHIPKQSEEEQDESPADLESTAGKEWVEVPRVSVSQARLQCLCSILRNESCRDSSFTKVNSIVRRLCRVDSNRGYVLGELATVADALGKDAVADLKALKIRLDQAADHKQRHEVASMDVDGSNNSNAQASRSSSSVALSTSTSELKLLRVLQTLQTLCLESWHDTTSKKSEFSVVVTEELVHLLRQIDLNELWSELTSCLSVVQVLEGVKALESVDADQGDPDRAEDADGEENSKKKLRNSAAGLLTRFLPAIEAFFVANASATLPTDDSSDKALGKMSEIPIENLVGGQRVLSFVATNKVLLNALVRNNSGLLDKGFRALVQVSRCRVYLDFDVKQQWFKMQMRRLRQQASRRHGSLRLHIRRRYVFEDAYHQLRLRNADEVRGRLHITFRNEEGVDAGGLSREFFAILAKEIFNPNYALFTSTEDGCTFQPNPNSSINPDHLSYFRFVGRIVGKAVSDGYLLDAHFTRSLYKHMLGMKPTYHDMEAIDPDYYRNLKMILEYNLPDLGLDLNFSIEDHSFGRSHTIDLIPGGRSIHVTDENKEEYVRLVCQHRMTTAIESQIKAYLDGFYELVPADLVAIFTPRELELLISGLPDIDVHDLKQHTEYVGWKVSDKEIEWFWNILFSLSRNEKASFLQFVTGSSKVPLAGFAELQGMRGVQKFSIHKTSGKAGALMSAHTCFNSLDLPNYSSEEEMRSKLLFAINEGGGAFLFA